MTRERGRPSGDKAVLSDELLRQAFRLFAAEGFEAVSMRRLAAESGVDAALYRHYFGSKEALWRRAIETELLPLAQNLLAMLVNQRHDHDPIVGLQRNIRACLMLVVTAPEKAGVLFKDTGPDSERTRWLYETICAPYLHYIDEAFVLAQQQGLIRQVPLESIHALIIGIVRMLIDPGLMQPRMQPILSQPAAKQAFIDGALETLFAGMRCHP